MKMQSRFKVANISKANKEVGLCQHLVRWALMLALVFAFSTFDLQNVYAGSSTTASSTSQGDRGTTGTGGSAQQQPSSSMHSGAGTAQAQQMLGAAMNGAIGGYMLSQCPDSGWMCAMGALALAQAALQMASAADSGAVGDATALNVPSGLSDSSFTQPQDQGQLNDLKAGYDKLNVPQKLKELAAKGYTVDPKTGTVSTPNGPVAASSLSSAAGLESLGMSPEQAQNIMDTTRKIAKKVADKYKVDAMGIDSSAGGGGLMASTFHPTEFKMDPGLAALFANKKAKSPAGSKGPGFQRTSDGEPIGVKSDDIFEMVHRRYRALAKQHFFSDGQ